MGLILTETRAGGDRFRLPRPTRPRRPSRRRHVDDDQAAPRDGHDLGAWPRLVRDESGYANGLLCLRQRRIPRHNLLFLVVAVGLSAAAFLVLPRGERRIRVPYLLLGAAFFLLETSNVVRMALLFGSTWWVNTVVFAGILAAAAVPSSLLLELPSLLRAPLAVLVYLGPVFFGGLIFARLIENEGRLYEAYGSNVLGAVVGGSAEYLSLVFGFQFLLALALACYLGVFVLLRRDVSLRIA